MTLVERYLSAVRFFLPRHQQDDIVRELEANLASDIDARQEVLGRELSEIEIADILRRHGHPVVAAGRYGRQQQLIGPVVFPIYVLALKVGLVAAALITILIAVVTAVSRGGSVPHLVDAILDFPNRALIVFAWTTLSFAVLDMAGSHVQVKADWDPRRIPDWMAGGRKPKPSSVRINSLAEVVFGLIGLGWLVAVPTSPVFALGPLAAVLDFAPIWQTWYLPLVVVAAARLAVDAYALIWPAVTARLIVVKLALLGAQLIIASFILAGRVWVVARPGAPDGAAHSAAEIAAWVNAAVSIGFVVVVIITVIEIGKQLYRLRAVPSAVDERASS